jgi:Uma2 family endonuclease
MNIQPNLRMDKAAFIAWGAAKEERYELVEGRVVMMARPSRAHGLIITNLIVALQRRLDPKQWVVISEFGLDTGPETLRYPDVVVDRAGGGAKDYTATAAVLLAEVLSPSSVEPDLGDKAAEYLQIPGLLAYIVLSQDEPKAWVYAKTNEKITMGPVVITGTEAAVRIGVLQLDLPMADIYAGIQTS